MSGELMVVGQQPAQENYLTLRVGNMYLGLHVAQVRDVLPYRTLTPIPLAPACIAGMLNWRGRVVTVMDLRSRLSLGTFRDLTPVMLIVVELEGELFALMADTVNEVLALPASNYENLPPNMNEEWQIAASGVYKQEDELLVILDLAGLVDPLTKGQAA